MTHWRMHWTWPVADTLPCPLCRSSNLHFFSVWKALHDGMHETPTVHCKDCLCEASLKSWSTRKPAPLPAAWLLVEALRAEEGHSVTLICDNPDFNMGPNNQVECCGDYTGWHEVHFAGDTLTAALLSAYLKMTGGDVASTIAESLKLEVSAQ